jgi:hypothetical protein
MNPEKDRKKTTSPRKTALTTYNTTMPELAVVSKNKQKKSRRKQKRHVFVASGIYRHTREGTYHERPKINGKRTWRSLGVNATPQRNFKAAEDEYHRRRVMQAEGKNPYAEAAAEEKPAFKKERPAEAKIVGEVIRRYMNDGFLDRHLLSRPETTEDDERRHCETLLEFWDSVPVEDVCDMVFDDYRGWRLKNLRQGEGLRTTDRELNTLNNAYTYSSMLARLGAWLQCLCAILQMSRLQSQVSGLQTEHCWIGAGSWALRPFVVKLGRRVWHKSTGGCCPSAFR